jgi:hypothetical protein
MRQTLCILSVVTLGLMGVLALVENMSDPGPALVAPWIFALVLAVLTLWSGIETSLQCRQFAWLGGLLAAGVVGLLGLVVTVLIPIYPRQMISGIQLDHLLNVVPFLPAGVGLTGLVYSLFLRTLASPVLPRGQDHAAGAASPPSGA